MDEREISRDEQLSVMGALERVGITCTLEYPGAVVIHAGDRAAWTGFHSWTYASWVDFDGQPMDDVQDAPHGLTEQTSDPYVIAAAWAKVVL